MKDGIKYQEVMGKKVGFLKALGDERFKNRSCKLKTGVCANCDIYEYCYGGCPFVAESTHGTIYAKDNTCAAQRKIVHYIKEYLMRYKKQ